MKFTKRDIQKAKDLMEINIEAIEESGLELYFVSKQHPLIKGPAKELILKSFDQLMSDMI